MTEVIDRESVAVVTNTAHSGSSRVYVEGSRPDLRVPFREILQAPTRGVTGDTPNLPLRLYDTSGPHGDPEITVDPKTVAFTEYVLPEPYGIDRETWIDNSTDPVTVWYVDHEGWLVRIQPLD